MSYENNSEPENVRKIFVGGLSRDTTDESLKTFYEQWGETQDVVVMKDALTKRSRGFGFVTYKSSEMVNTAMDNRPHNIDGKQVDPKRAVPREEGQRAGGDGNVSSKRLYVANVRDLSEDQIREYFAKFGGIEKIDIIIDKVTNQPRGFCFITFDDYDPVDKCVLERYHQIGSSRCEAKKGLNKEEQNRAQMNRDRMGRFGQSRGMGRDMGPGRGGYGGYGGDAGGYQQYGAQQYYQGQGGYGGAAGYGGYAQGWGGDPAQAQWGQQAAGGGYDNGQWGQGAAAAAWGGAQQGGGAGGDSAANTWGGAPHKY